MHLWEPPRRKQSVPAANRGQIWLLFSSFIVGLVNRTEANSQIACQISLESVVLARGRDNSSDSIPIPIKLAWLAAPGPTCTGPPMAF
jgi:hypothetical protein